MSRGSKEAIPRLHLRGHNSPLWKGTKDIPRSYLCLVHQGALRRSRKIAFSIKIEDLQKQWDQQRGLCAYSGVPLHFGPTRKVPGTASLDRIDSAKGYEVGNIQWVHKDVNLAKQSLDEETFLSMVAAIADYRLGMKP